MWKLKSLFRPHDSVLAVVRVRVSAGQSPVESIHTSLRSDPQLSPRQAVTRIVPCTCPVFVLKLGKQKACFDYAFAFWSDWRFFFFKNKLFSSLLLLRVLAKLTEFHLFALEALRQMKEISTVLLTFLYSRSL